VSNFKYSGWNQLSMWLASLLVVLLVALLPVQGFASNRQLEAEYHGEITRNLELGEALILDAGGQSFLALYTLEASRFVHGGAIILHDQGGHPDRSGVVFELRRQLIDHGWQTLSLQMPLFHEGTPDWEQFRLIPDAQARITAAVDYFKQQGMVNVVLLGHGLGGKMVLSYLAKDAPEEVRAAVLVGMPVTELEGDTSYQDLAVIKLPLLDIYGTQDGSSVLGTARKRQASAKKAGSDGYRQLEMEGADHQFRGLLPALISRIYTWLGETAPGKELNNVPKTNE